MTHEVSWTGLWEGHYAYSSGELGTFPFKLRLSENDGSLRGMTIEDGADHGDMRKGEITGTCDARSLEFVKTYVSDGLPFGRPIRYEGTANSEGTAVSGAWFLPDDQGTFEMHRPA